MRAAVPDAVVLAVRCAAATQVAVRDPVACDLETGGARDGFDAAVGVARDYGIHDPDVHRRRADLRAEPARVRDDVAALPTDAIRIRARYFQPETVVTGDVADQIDLADLIGRAVHVNAVQDVIAEDVVGDDRDAVLRCAVRGRVEPQALAARDYAVAGNVACVSKDVPDACPRRAVDRVLGDPIFCAVAARAAGTVKVHADRVTREREHVAADDPCLLVAELKDDPVVQR